MAKKSVHIGSVIGPGVANKNSYVSVRPRYRFIDGDTINWPDREKYKFENGEVTIPNLEDTYLGEELVWEFSFENLDSRNQPMSLTRVETVTFEGTSGSTVEYVDMMQVDPSPLPNYEQAAVEQAQAAASEAEAFAASINPAQFPVISDPTAGAALQAAQAGALNVVGKGHSLLYGQDTTAAGTNPPINGATQTRSAKPTLVQFQSQGEFLSAGTLTTVDQSFPGDRSTEALTRFLGVPGQVYIVWIDTNDGNDYGSHGGTLTDAQTATNVRELVSQARDEGAEVVVVGGSPDGSDAASRRGFASAQTDRTIAERLGARYIDAGELLRALPKHLTLFSAGVHLQKEGYTVVGARLGALIGPKGMNPPKVGPGATFTVRDRVATNRGSDSAQAGAADGRVWWLGTSQTLSLAVDVVVPCVPVIRFRADATNGQGIAGIYYNLGFAGRATRFVSIAHSERPGSPAFTYVMGQPMMSPGPDSIVIRAETNQLMIDSITFVPVDFRNRLFGGDPKFDVSHTKRINLAPVGGPDAGRFSSTWDSVYDLTSGVSITSDAAATVGVETTWRFEAALGANNSGVVLAAALLPDGTAASAAHQVQQGYLFWRNGVDLTCRRLGATSTTVGTWAGAFASATGVARCFLDIHYDPTLNQFDVYLDGTLLTGAVATPTWKHYTAGLVAGTSAGGGYANASGSVIQKSITNP